MYDNDGENRTNYDHMTGVAAKLVYDGKARQTSLRVHSMFDDGIISMTVSTSGGTLPMVTHS